MTGWLTRLTARRRERWSLLHRVQWSDTEYMAMMRSELVNVLTIFEVSIYTRYGSNKGGANCRNWGGLGRLGVTQGRRRFHHSIEHYNFLFKFNTVFTLYNRLYNRLFNRGSTTGCRSVISICCGSAVQLVPKVLHQLTKFRWYNASRGPSAVAELLVQWSIAWQRSNFDPYIHRVP